MKFKYGLEERPPWGVSLIIGVQWCALVVPFMIILGKVACAVHATDTEALTGYLQKTAFIMALFLFLEIILGHRFPLVMGPSAILLISILSSHGFDADITYTSLACGGFALTIAGATGFFGVFQPLFTHRVVAGVLLLISVTLIPTILHLIRGTEHASFLFHVLFSVSLTVVTLICHRYARGIWQSLLVLLTMTGGTILYFFLVPESFSVQQILSHKAFSSFFNNAIIKISFDTGLTLSFLISFIALSINDVGSIQSIHAFAKSTDIVQRINRGIFITGIANVVSGLFGVIGQVNYSISVGLVTATGSLSRFTLIPAAAILLLISFSPFTIGLLGIVPPVVIGSIMFYLLCSQAYASLKIAFEATQDMSTKDGVIMSAPLIVALFITFVPQSFITFIPELFRPLVGNGFVMGFITLLILEHLIFRKDSGK